MAPRPQLVLGSGSPFRRALLAAAGLAFEVRTAPIDEDSIRHTEPRELARLRARGKGEAVARLIPGAIVIGADQVASLDGVPFGKAHDRAAARARLASLAGQTHHLHSAYALLRADAAGRVDVLADRIVDVPMPMRTLTSAEIEAYLDTGEWEGCVGCYQYEHRGINLMAASGGDQSAIIGLPLVPLLADLRALGITAF